jgi:hypothetical protein
MTAYKMILSASTSACRIGVASFLCNSIDISIRIRGATCESSARGIINADCDRSVRSAQNRWRNRGIPDMNMRKPHWQLDRPEFSPLSDDEGARVNKAGWGHDVRWQQLTGFFISKGTHELAPANATVQSTRSGFLPLALWTKSPSFQHISKAAHPKGGQDEFSYHTLFRGGENQRLENPSRTDGLLGNFGWVTRSLPF